MLKNKQMIEKQNCLIGTCFVMTSIFTPVAGRPILCPRALVVSKFHSETYKENRSVQILHIYIFSICFGNEINNLFSAVTKCDKNHRKKICSNM